jgi:uncharacterized membrane protein (DUF2068 family)
MNGRKQDRALLLIALFKLGKATLLIAVCLGALQLLNPDISARAQRWTMAIATSSDRLLFHHLLAGVLALSPARLEVVALGALAYAGLFAAEGVGLWLGRRWAEYLTVVETASFLPIEIVELVRRLTSLRMTALVFNLLVVAYLIHRLRRSRV